MRTRICPLCDQPMKKAHYCDSCNSFVWKPVYIDIHYNTSGSSGQDCAYDAVQHDYSYHEDGSVTTMPVPERKPVLKRHPKTEKWEAPEFREIYGGEETGRKNHPERADWLLFWRLPWYCFRHCRRSLRALSIASEMNLRMMS